MIRPIWLRRGIFKGLVRVAQWQRRRGHMNAYFKTLGLAMRVSIGQDGPNVRG